ncbi:MAG: hypothetical protein AAFR04_15320 [Pseudomonadota bacterium]
MRPSGTSHRGGAASGYGSDRWPGQAQAQWQVQAGARRTQAGASRVTPSHFAPELWLAALHRYGGDLGPQAARAATRIFRTRSGRLYVPQPGERQAILKLRAHGPLGRALAARMAHTHRIALFEATKAPVQLSDVIAAHYLGVAGALKLSRARRRALKAVELMPTRAFQHLPLFFDGARARTVREVRRIMRRAAKRARAALAIAPHRSRHASTPAVAAVAAARSASKAPTARASLRLRTTLAQPHDTQHANRAARADQPATLARLTFAARDAARGITGARALKN